MKTSRVLKLTAALLAVVAMLVAIAGCVPVTPAPQSSAGSSTAPAASTSAPAPQSSASSSSASSAPAGAQPTTAAAASGKVYKVGVTEIIAHPVIDASFNGFKNRMTELGWVEGKNIEYEVKNAQGDTTNASAIAKQFVASQKDLIVGLGTSSILAAAKETKDIPIIFIAMSDPVGGGVAKSLDKPGGNATGTIDAVPPEDQLQIIKDAFPSAKNIGTIINPSEANSKSWLDGITPAAQKMGMTFISVPVAGTSDVQGAAQSLVGRVDIIFLGPDNTVAGATEAVVKTAVQNKIPVIGDSTEGAGRGELLGMGVDYGKLGSMAADQADKVLKGTKPGDIAIQKLPQLAVAVNVKTMNDLGIKLPDAIMNRATKVGQ